MTAVQVVEASPVKARRRARLLGRSPSDTPAGPLTYAILVFTILLSAFPVYWMLVVASSTEEETAKIPPSVVPKANLAENVQAVFSADNVHFVESLLNSVFVASIVTASVLFFCSLAGFAFAKLRFRGRNVLIVVLIATLAVPNQLNVVALYIFMSKLD